MNELTYENFERILKNSNPTEYDWKKIDLLLKAVRKFTTNDSTNMTIALTPVDAPFHCGKIDIEALLKISICIGDTTVTRILFDHGAKLEKISRSDFKLISDELFSIRDKRKSMLELLMEHDFKNIARFRWKRGTTLLNSFLRLVGEFDQEVAEVIDIFLNSGLSKINGYDCNGETPLISAIYTRDTNLVSFLLNKGADPCLPSQADNCLPLTNVLMLSTEEMFNALVSHGADVNGRGIDGCTIFHNLCYQNIPNAISLLIKNNADLFAEVRGMTPLLYLAEHNSLNDCEEALVVMIKNISRLNFENRPVPDKDMNWIRNNPIAHEHFVNCSSELREMSNTIFWNSQTLYSLLNMNWKIKKLSNLLNNMDFRSKIREKLYRFTYFKRELFLNFDEAKEAWTNKFLVELRLKAIFKKSILPDLAIEKIAENLTLEDVPTE